MATIYMPTFLEPANISVDMSVNQDFTCIVQGLMINKYQLIIYKNSDNTLLYDTGQVTLGTALYNNETLNITVPGSSVSNGLELKWTVTYWNGTESVVSNEIFFISASTATLTISVPALINSQSYTFVGTYTQAQNIPIRQWYYVLYDSSATEILRTDTTFSGNISYTFEGFISDETYGIKAFAETQDNNSIESPYYVFEVSYSSPLLITEPIAMLLPEKTAVNINWGTIESVSGSISGGTYGYIDDFVYVGNHGLNLGNGAKLEFNVNIPVGYTYQIGVFQVQNLSFIGDMGELYNSISNEYFKVGYNGTTFYKNINGNITNYLNNYPLTTNYFQIILQYNKVYINEFNSSAVKINSIIL